MSEISYSYMADDVADDELSEFFVAWSQPPRNEARRQVLQAATEVIIARDHDGTLVGFITALTDGMFAAYIPLLEVRAENQREGSRALVERMLVRLRDCYMIDLVCDDDVAAFYERVGGQRFNAVVWRNYGRLSALA